MLGELGEYVGFEFLRLLGFLGQQERCFVERFSQLLLGEEREVVELEQREVVRGGIGADAGEVHEPDDRFWRLAEPVFHLGKELVDFGE